MKSRRNKARDSVRPFVSARAKLEKKLGIDLRRNYRQLSKQIESDYLNFGVEGVHGAIERNRSILSDLLGDFYTATIGKLASMQQNKLLRKKELNPTDFIAVSQDFIITQQSTKSIMLTNTTARVVDIHIARELAEGKGSVEIARTMRKLVGVDLAAHKSRTIARTEIGNAASYAQDIGARATGLLLNKQWIAVTDDATRSDHSMVSGDQIGMEDYFSVGGFQMLHPNDSSAPAGEVINCRCVLNYVPVQ